MKLFSFTTVIYVLILAYLSQNLIDFWRYEITAPVVIETTQSKLMNMLTNDTDRYRLEKILIERTHNYGLFVVTYNFTSNSSTVNTNRTLTDTSGSSDTIDTNNTEQNQTLTSNSSVYGFYTSFYSTINSIMTYETSHEIYYKIYLPYSDEHRIIDEIKNTTTNSVSIEYYNEPNLVWRSFSVGDILMYVFILFLVKFCIEAITSSNAFKDLKKIDITYAEDIFIRFNDIIGQDEAKERLKLYVDLIKNRLKYKNIGASLPRGVLLCGPPGCGKTYLAKAVAGESGVNFLAISGSDFDEMLVGVGSTRVKKLFEVARTMAPSIIFIDEIDSIGEKRTDIKVSSKTSETLNTILTEMDGFKNTDNVLVLAATNRENSLDKALLRSGRFDSKIYIDLPRKKDRAALFKSYLSKKTLDPNITTEQIDELCERLADHAPHITGADVKNICNHAAMTSVSKGKEYIDESELVSAIDDIIIGLTKTSHKCVEQELRTTAYHEAGHALMYFLLKDATKPLKISIVPRGHGIAGYTKMSESNNSNKTREQLFAEVYGALAGRCAELVKFNIVSTGASSDFEKATEIIRMMVTKEGMYSQFGPIVYDIDKNSPKCVSETKRHEIEMFVQAELKRMFSEVMRILRKYTVELDNLATKLLEDEILEYRYLKDTFTDIENTVDVQLNTNMCYE